MEKEQINRELIENMVKNAPGFRGNEDLIDYMLDECLKKASSFLETTSNDNSQNAYIKKIVNSTVVDIAKRAEKIRAEKIRKSQEASSFQEIPLKYRTDEKGKIIGDKEIELPENTEDEIPDEKIEEIKTKINKTDKENPEKQYGKIFEMRFIKEMDYQEIAEKLEKPQEEVLKTLRDIFREVKPLVVD